MTFTQTALMVGTVPEVESGEFGVRVQRQAAQDHMVAIAFRVIGRHCVVLLAAAPSVN